MANESTTSTADDLVLAAALSAEAVDAARAASVMNTLIRQESLAYKGSHTLDVPLWGAVSVSSLTEGTAASYTAISTTKKTISTAEKGVAFAITDSLLASSMYGAIEPYARQGSLALAEQMDADAIALFSGFSSTVGSTGVDLTLDTMADAIATLDAANAPRGPSTPWAFVLHPRQAKTFRKLIAGTNGSAATYLATGAGADVTTSQTPGFLGHFLGVAVFMSTKVPTVNAGVDYCGALLCSEALCRATLIPPTVIVTRNALLRGHDLVVYSRFGHGELVDAFGCGIVSKVAA